LQLAPVLLGVEAGEVGVEEHPSYRYQPAQTWEGMVEGQGLLFQGLSQPALATAAAVVQSSCLPAPAQLVMVEAAVQQWVAWAAVGPLVVGAEQKGLGQIQWGVAAQLAHPNLTSAAIQHSVASLTGVTGRSSSALAQENMTPRDQPCAFMSQ